MIRSLVFDFDGVLVESNAGKERAYLEIFRAVPGLTELQVRETVGDNPGKDRFGVIEAVLDARLSETSARELAGELLGDTDRGVGTTRAKLVAWFAERYNSICEDHAASCPEVDGASDVLLRLAQRLPLYVVSLTPEGPLRRIVARRGWDGRFRAILGSPTAKVEHLQAIAAQEAESPSEVLFVGDHRVDREAARTVGCQFVGKENAFNDFQRESLQTVKALAELVDIVDFQNGSISPAAFHERSW